MSEVAVSVRGLSKSYKIAHDDEQHITLAETLLSRLKNPMRRPRTETFWALKDVNFDVQKGEVVGIIGRNGAGKSTLLKILSRITEPTAGEIDIFGRVGSLLEVGTGFHPELSGRENVYLNGAILGMAKDEISKQFDAIVDFAGVEQFLDTPVKRYSSGMYVRLAFAVAAHLRSDVLIVDEVLAVGDVEFQRKCLGKMKDVASGGRTVLFVSHNMTAVAGLCTTGLFLAGGVLHASGKIDGVIRDYMDRGFGSEIRPEKGPIKCFRVYQEGEALIMEAEWQHTYVMRLPNLGYCIHDSMGAPISSGNPLLSGVENGDQPRDRGHIIAKLTEPRLLDGRYYLSLYFGDGITDFIELPQCISFDVRGMAGTRQNAPSTGPVAPRCSYTFSGISDAVPSAATEPLVEAQVQ